MRAVERRLLDRLIDWKNDPQRKPLVLRGARQVGKTWILREFAQRCFPQHVYLNFEEDPNLESLFAGPLSPERIVRDIELYARVRIEPGRCLILLDEIQLSSTALNSLKYFNERGRDYPIAAAGSLLGLRFSGSRSFPVGQVNFLSLAPLSFLEFLIAHDESGLADEIEHRSDFHPLPEALHLRLVELLRLYLFVGGMPEAVAHHAGNRNPSEVRRIQREILRGYHADFAKYADPPDIPKMSLVWESIPAQLAKENRKFVFAALRKSARGREYENAIAWLDDAGLILHSYSVSAPRLPLKGYAQPNAYKIYALDVGLLCALSHLPEAALVEGNRLFEEFKGALTENYVAQQLALDQDGALFYWKSDRAEAEVDFVVEHDGAVFPLEAKAGVNPKSKSLRSYGERFAPKILSRATLLNWRRDGSIVNYPLYGVSRFPGLAL